jgi:uncharacterized repeat protein (TIGR01451 family)
MKSKHQLKWARQIRPMVELLEDRTVPSVSITPDYTVLSGHVPNPLGGNGPGNGYSPSQMQQAYGFSNINFGGVVGDGRGETIAIVDAYNDPNIQSDLTTFDNYPWATGPLAAPPSFQVVNQNGGTSLPASDKGWAEEISLDVEWAHAIAPGAKILLVEANSNSLSDLLTAVNYASTQAQVVSMSWGASEFSIEGLYDSFFSTAGVTYVASAGDGGSPPGWPAISTHVLSVGGTSLTLDANNNWFSETTWNNISGTTGGGLSAYLAEPSYEQGVVPSTIDPKSVRANPDVAYNGDPYTGVSVFDSYQEPGWMVFGGTSAGAPQWSALIAIADQGLAAQGKGPLSYSDTLSKIYQISANDFHDITTGNNNTYSALSGYDLVTGRGTPIANLVVGDLVGNSVAPPSADMVVTAGGPSSVTAGTNATYTITITNKGPSAAQGVVLSNALPTGSTFVSMTQTAGSDHFTQSGATETANGSIASNSSDTFSLVVAAPASLSNGASFNDTASVSATTFDPNTANNTSMVTGSIVNNSGPSLTVGVQGPGSANEGDKNLTYTITVTNTGTSDATGVVVTDTLSANLGNVSASSGGNVSGGVVTFNGVTIAANTNVIFTVTAQAVEDGTATSSASVTSTNAANASGSATTSIAEGAITPASFTARKTIPGNSSSSARTVSFSSLFPSGITFTHASGVEPATAFTATINWGDGSSSTANAFIQNPDGSYSMVTGPSHTFPQRSRSKTYTITVTVVEAGSSPNVGDLQFPQSDTPPAGNNAIPSTNIVSQLLPPSAPPQLVALSGGAAVGNGTRAVVRDGMDIPGIQRLFDRAEAGGGMGADNSDWLDAVTAALAEDPSALGQDLDR